MNPIDIEIANVMSIILLIKALMVIRDYFFPDLSEWQGYTLSYCLLVVLFAAPLPLAMIICEMTNWFAMRRFRAQRNAGQLSLHVAPAPGNRDF